MKYHARQYALSLIQACEGHDKKTCELIMTRWFDLLSERRQLNLLVEILIELENYYKQGKIEALVESARPLTHELRLWIKEYLKTQTDAKEVLIREKVTSNLLAGLVLRYQDKELNLSLQGVLKQLSDKIAE